MMETQSLGWSCNGHVNHAPVPLGATPLPGLTPRRCHSTGTSMQHPPVSGDEMPEDAILMLERRPLRPFRSSEEYLYAMKEDLAEWLNALYDLKIDADNFFDVIETGVVLCKHAANVRRAADVWRTRHPTPMTSSPRRGSSKLEVPQYDVVFRTDVVVGSFFARDNVHNFIRWCRDLGVHEVLLFETEDLVMRKNEKHVILSLLEVARWGGRFGMPTPLLVQMEADIDREMEKDRLRGEGEEGEVDKEDSEPPLLIYGPQPQVVTNDLKSLDEMVRDLVERCSCPSQFPMVKVSDGKYRIGDTKVLIFVRILRNHVMVRVGGGWDTLQHYLEKHDPCRCRSGHRFAIGPRIGFKHTNNERQLQSVTYEGRLEEGLLPSSPMARRRSNAPRRESAETKMAALHNRSQSPVARDLSPRRGNGMPCGRDEPTSVTQEWCDSSSEVSDEGYKSQGPAQPSVRVRKGNSRTDSAAVIERPESSMTHLSSEGSTVSTDDLGVPPTPPRSPGGTSPTENLPSYHPWNSAPHSSKQASDSNLSKGLGKSKIPFLESLNSQFTASRKSKKCSLTDDARSAWNMGPTGKPERSASCSHSRRNSTSEPPEGRKISRSRSTTSDGGFQNMQRDVGGCHSLRSQPHGLDASDCGKNTWSGRTRRGGHPSLSSEIFRPPLGTRNVRSASASPATVRRCLGSSVPSTPILGNRFPKYSAPSSTITSPTRANPEAIIKNLSDLAAEPNLEILAHLEDLVNSYRNRVMDKFAAEGLTLPPELIEDVGTRYGSSTPLPTEDKIPVKIVPRKDGVGSRIPAPVFYKKQAEI